MKSILKTISAFVATSIITSSVLVSGVAFAAEQAYGDLNKDSKVDMEDVKAFTSEFYGKKVESGTEYVYWDVDRDTVLTPNDKNVIKGYVEGSVKALLGTYNDEPLPGWPGEEYYDPELPGSPEGTKQAYGDLNNDKKIDYIDLNMFDPKLFGTEVVPGSEYVCWDLDLDKVLSRNDKILLSKYATEMIFDLPVAEELSIAISSAEGKVDDIVKVDVKLSGVPKKGIGSCLFDVVFDQSKLQFASIEQGTIVFDPSKDISTNLLSEGLRVLYLNDNGIDDTCIKTDGVLLSINFRIKSTGTFDITPIRLDFADNRANILKMISSEPGTIVGTSEGSSVQEILGLSIGSAEGKVGDNVTVDVNLSGVPKNGVEAGTVDILFDRLKLEFVSLSAGSIVYDKKDIESNLLSQGLRVLYIDNNCSKNTCITSDGVLFKVTFKIKSSGVHPLKLVTDGFCDYDINELGFNKLESGEITAAPSETQAPTAVPTVAPPVTHKPIKTPVPVPTKVPVKNPLNISVGSAQGKVGDTVTIDIKLSGVSKRGVEAGLFILDYDQRKLKLVSVKAGSIVRSQKDIESNLSPDGLRILYLNSSSSIKYFIKKNGTLCKVTFKILAEGKTTLKASTTDVFCDYDLNTYPVVKFKSGTITGKQSHKVIRKL